MAIRRHQDMSPLSFFKRTISAQLHLLGMLGAAAGCLVLLHYSAEKAGTNHHVACVLFALTSLAVFGASAVYHFLSDGFEVSPALNKRLNDFDHFAIYCFIAGTYTVFLLNAVPNPTANILLVLIWVIAATGILYTHFKTHLPLVLQHRFFSTSIFVGMGWLIVFCIGEIVAALSERVFWWLILGGLSYTLGAVIYATKRPRLFAGVFGYHELWHIAVMLGYTFHFLVVLSFYRQ